MTSSLPEDDDALLTELRTALGRVDAAPPALLAAAKATYLWRTIDEELAFASLSFDSLLDTAGDDRGPSTARPRALVFDAAGLSMELEVTAQEITGQLVPPGDGQVTMTSAHGADVTVEVDEVGCFSVPRQGTGPLRLTCRTEGATLRTPWLLL